MISMISMITASYCIYKIVNISVAFLKNALYILDRRYEAVYSILYKYKENGYKRLL